MATKVVKIEVDPTGKFVQAVLWGFVLALAVVAAMPLTTGLATAMVVVNLTKAALYSDWGMRQEKKSKKGNK